MEAEAGSNFEQSFEVVKSLPQFSAQGKLFIVREIPQNGKYKYDQNGSELMVKALRLIRSERDDETPELINARREVDIMQMYQHENLVRYYAHFEEVHPRGFTYKDPGLKNADDVFFRFIVMEYCAGGDLTAWAQRETRTTAEIESVIGQIAEALLYIHENRILHRDIKSPNIFLGKNNKVKIGDFGSARIKEDVHSSRVGTEIYRAPEITKKGSHVYDEKVDVYSAGIVFLEHILGVAAQYASSIWFDKLDNFKKGGIFPANALESFPDKCVLVAMMMEKNPARRISSFGVHQWTLGNYIHLDAKTGRQFGSLKESMTHIKIINCEYLLNLETPMQIQLNQEGKRIFDEMKLNTSNLIDVVFEFDNDREGNWLTSGSNVFSSLSADVAGLENLMSFCGPVSEWITKINVTLTNFVRSTKFRMFQVRQSPKRSLSSIIKVPRECLCQEWEEVALQIPPFDFDTTYQFSMLADLVNLKCVYLNKLKISQTKIDINWESCSKLEHLCIQGRANTFPKLSFPKPIPNLKSLHLGCMDVTFKNVTFPNLQQLSFDDCVICNLEPPVYSSHLERVAFFTGPKNLVSDAELADQFFLSESVKEVFYEAINFPEPSQPSFLTYLKNYFLKSPTASSQQTTEPWALRYLRLSSLPKTSKYVMFTRPKNVLFAFGKWTAKIMTSGDTENMKGKFNGSWNWTWEPVDWIRN